MSLTKLTKEVDNISALSDYPNSTEGLSSQDLKERFDKASVDIKDYINSTLTDELDTIHANYEETLATKEEVDLDYLKKTDAEATYETIENVDAYKDEVDETYLKKTDASSIYLTQEDASEDYLTKQEASTTYDTISNVANIYATKQALAEAQMGAIVDQSVTKQKLSLDVQATLDNAETNIDDLVTSVASINGKIPSEASASNQLADKDYVDGRVQENTANFIGRFDSVAELEAYSGTLTNNDYAYVVTQVVGGNDQIVRYKWNATTEEWVEEFDMNTTIFTESQLDTINSGLDASDKAKIDNVSSYLTPSVEKVLSLTPILVNDVFEVVSPTWNSGGNIGTRDIRLKSKYANYDLIIRATDTWNSGISSSVSYPRIIAADGGGWNYKSSAISKVLSNVVKNDSDYIYLEPAIQRNPDFIFDFKGKYETKISYYFDYSTSYITTHIYGSDDNTTWVDLGTIANNTNTIFTNSSKYRYIKFSFIINDGSGTITLYKLFIPDTEHYEYQNAFTLDNNTTFTNNQRVLVEAPQQKGEQKYIINQDFNVSQDGLIAVNSDGFKITAKDYITYGITNSVNGDYNDSYWSAYNSASNEEKYIIYEFPQPLYISKIVEKIHTNQNAYTTAKGAYSLDGINYTNIFESDYSRTINTHTFEPVLCKYIKVYSTTTNNSNNEAMQVHEIEFYKYNNIGMELDGVGTNTLNGIDIPTLLQPSTKYELIYKEEEDKFVFGNLTEKKPLFDMTITEEVSRIELAGISKQFEIGHLYAFIYSGTTNASNSNWIKLGGSNAGNLNATAGNASFYVFTPYIKTDTQKKHITGIIRGPSSSTGSDRGSGQIEDKEYIDYGSYKFGIGSRIVIKEVL